MCIMRRSGSINWFDQRLFHLMKGGDVRLFELRGTLASEAHREEREAVAGNLVAGKFAANRIGVFIHRKIAGNELGGTLECTYLFQNIVMTFGEVVSDS